MLGFLDIFNVSTGLLDWILVAVGGAAGFFLVRRFKEMHFSKAKSPC